ncbi:mitotic spindle assembly checkpoint protein MAD1 isoform X3 [Oryctolagus cuniculus]|uniref:mitotic spindle assembly checkpoint protein MAD1 isoform X3 n=1 Tax=Oryctolagus cuniculus TaxID=9986 RepID=UPI0038798742
MAAVSPWRDRAPVFPTVWTPRPSWCRIPDRPCQHVPTLPPGSLFTWKAEIGERRRERELGGAGRAPVGWLAPAAPQEAGSGQRCTAPPALSLGQRDTLFTVCPGWPGRTPYEWPCRVDGASVLCPSHCVSQVSWQWPWRVAGASVLCPFHCVPRVAWQDPLRVAVEGGRGFRLVPIPLCAPGGLAGPLTSGCGGWPGLPSCARSALPHLLPSLAQLPALAGAAAAEADDWCLGVPAAAGQWPPWRPSWPCCLSAQSHPQLACCSLGSARALEKAQQQLQEEVRQVSGQLLEERKKREAHEALARRLQKRVLLLTKERDGMRAILGSYDSELTQAEYSPQLTRRMREAEDMVQKVLAHSADMEAQLSQALEDLGGQKQRADMLEMELKMLTTRSSSAEPSFRFSREEVDSLRLKIEELEGERSRLEEEKKELELQLERRSLQGDYDQSRTKVLHLSQNPARAARQRLLEDQEQLQAECERLRGLVRALERGGPIPADLEAAASVPSSKEVAELRKQAESAQLKNQRLKEVFQSKIQEFRKACYSLTGYQIDITTENQYRLTSQYAERKADCLIFKATGPSGSQMQLLETEFSRSVPELIELHLAQQDSIPAFLSSLTLELFSRQTVA